jgi:transcriptional regulator with XRE-family HTH domain
MRIVTERYVDLMPMPGVPIDGKKLQAAREACRMSTTELAAAIGRTRGYVRLLETNTNRPSVEVLGRIEDALGVTAAQLGANVPARRKARADT